MRGFNQKWQFNITDQANVKAVTSAPPNHIVHNANGICEVTALICNVVNFRSDLIILQICYFDLINFWKKLRSCPQNKYHHQKYCTQDPIHGQLTFFKWMIHCKQCEDSEYKQNDLHLWCCLVTGFVVTGWCWCCRCLISTLDSLDF